MLVCVCTRVCEGVLVCAENKAQEPNSVSKVHWFFLQPASSPFDISQTLYSPEPIYRMMKARVALWPLNLVWCVSQTIISCDCGILGYCYMLIYPDLSSALAGSPLFWIFISALFPLQCCILKIYIICNSFSIKFLFCSALLRLSFSSVLLSFTLHCPSLLFHALYPALFPSYTAPLY